MLRYKGVLYLKGTDRRCVVQGVHMVFGADVLGPWGKDKPETKVCDHRSQNFQKRRFSKGLNRAWLNVDLKNVTSRCEEMAMDSSFCAIVCAFKKP